MLIKMRIRFEIIVRAYDRSIAPGVAASEPAFLEHCYIRNAVVLREIVRGCEAVSAAADDDDVVLIARLGTAPRARPVLVMAKRITGEREDRISQRRNLNGATNV